MLSVWPAYSFPRLPLTAYRLPFTAYRLPFTAYCPLPATRILIKYRIQYLFHLLHALFKVCCFIDHLIHHHL
ncbi:hypothetical protein GT078_004103 [Salmonella enterica]|nr:hypothetical protein [Salmonella enterica]